jgi:hypothetical protein
LSDEEVVSIAVRGLLPTVKERIGTDCSNLGMLAKRIANLEAQYRYSRYNKAQKAANVGFEFGPPLEDICNTLGVKHALTNAIICMIIIS